MATPLKRLMLIRYINGDKCTIGRLQDMERNLICRTLEPPEKGKTHRIPHGLYKCTRYKSPRLNGADVWLLHNVPSFEMVEIHIGNYPENTHGCILPGMSVAPNRKAVWRSKEALDAITSFIGGWSAGPWEIEIIDTSDTGVIA